MCVCACLSVGVCMCACKAVFSVFSKRYTLVYRCILCSDNSTLSQAGRWKRIRIYKNVLMNVQGPIHSGKKRYNYDTLSSKRLLMKLKSARPVSLKENEK